MKTSWASLIGILFALAASPAAAQTRLFSEDSEVQLLLEAPLTTLIREAPRTTAPRPATLTLLGAGEPQPWTIELSARGLSRRTRGYCTVPPLRLDLSAAATRGTVFQGQERLKLVVRCRPGSSYEQLVVLEYLAYRLYNEITPMSYRVRPARVTYRDTDGRRREETQFNYLIEHVDDVARRNRRVALEVQPTEVDATHLDPQAAARFALFQFMISNLDWDMTSGVAGEECCHNTKLLASSATSRSGLIPAPYDFDSSGLVAAPYAAPPNSLPVDDVRTRLYRGLCRHNDQAPAAIETFRSRRTALNAVIAGETRLSEARRRTAQRFIDGFFEIIDNPDRVERQIIQNCRR